MKHYVLCILSAIVVAAMILPAYAQETVTIVHGDGKAAEKIDAWDIEPGSEELYLRANDVARIFRATQFWNASSRKIVLGVERKRFTLTVDTRVVVVDGEPIMLRNPVRYDAGFVLIPMEFVLELAAPFSPTVFEWDPNTRTLHTKNVGYNVERVAFSSTGDRSTATIFLDEDLLHHVDSSTPGLVRLKLYGGRIDPNKFETRTEHGLFNGVRAEQTDRDAFVYFDIKKSTMRVEVTREDAPPRVVVTLGKGDLPEIPDVDFAGKGGIEIVEDRFSTAKDLKIETVVLDPGHGGKDDGKRGYRGTLEKEVNLQIAERTRRLLERELGVRVVLTREDDHLLSLTQRTEIANQADGDLFISIHCNSWFSVETGGFEAYFLSQARTEMDRAVARAENAADEFISGKPDVATDIDFILWDMVQNEYINESSYFAELIQKAMTDLLGIRNRGVKQANFTVLQGAQMPAILVETAFLSNPDEEALLATDGFQDKVAEGILDAVRRFKERYE